MSVLDQTAETMPALAHLRELRQRVITCLVVVAVATAVAWVLYNHVVGFMVGPYRQFLASHPHENIAGGNLVATAPLEGFTTRLKVSGYLGLVIAAPVLFFQSWRFVTPGLHRTEQRYAAGFVVAAVTLFAFGAATAVVIFPKAVSWMISVGGSSVAPLFSPGSYLGMYALCCLVFGIAFTYPVVLVFLELVGLLPSARLRKWRRYAIVLILGISAFITPSSDPFSFVALAIPLLVFYEASIFIGRILKR